MDHVVLPKRIYKIEQETKKEEKNDNDEVDLEQFQVLEDYDPHVVRDIQYEYLDNTADIQIHSWGSTLTEALEQIVMGMFGYITDASTIQYDEDCKYVEAHGHDMYSLLFNYMDEHLFNFCTTGYVSYEIKILECDLTNWVIKSLAVGEKFNKDKHPAGTEIKAITYSNMNVKKMLVIDR